MEFFKVLTTLIDLFVSDLYIFFQYRKSFLVHSRRWFAQGMNCDFGQLANGIDAVVTPTAPKFGVREVSL